MIFIYVDDGKWYTINVERNDKYAELILDNKYINMVIVSGKSRVLNLLNNDVYFGVDVVIGYNGYSDVRRGFDGCMEEIKLFSIVLLFKGRNVVVKFQEFQEVEFYCKNILFLFMGLSEQGTGFFFCWKYGNYFIEILN